MFAKRLFYICAGLLCIGAYSGCSDNSPTRPRGPTYQLVQTWGTYGSGDGQFRLPWDVALDGGGNVYTADTFNHRIQVFSHAGAYLYQWGDSGSANGQFRYPLGVTVDASGNVYVTDWDNHRVQKFAGDGTYLTQWGTEGTGNGQFRELGGIAVRGSGNVYVTDVTSQSGVAVNRVQVFSTDGAFLTAWGDTCRNIAVGNATHFEGDVALDDDGNVYVADADNYRIRKFTGTGTYITQWGTYGYDNGQFRAAEGVAVDASGNVFVTDLYNSRVQKFTGTGSYLTQWDAGVRGCAPSGMAIDSHGNVYVAERNICSRIQRFAPALVVR